MLNSVLIIKIKTDIFLISKSIDKIKSIFLRKNKKTKVKKIKIKTKK